MSVKVRIPTQLRPLAGGSAEVEVEAATVGEALKGLDAAHPGFAERIFDEIYYARSAQEYIHHLPQFEWTHPPLSKLILTLGALVYRVDPIGARLASALFGTLTVPLLYAFAKRLFSSTPAAITSGPA